MNLAGVDLNLLVALDALLTEENVTRAAARTSVGQSAMSASLGRLRSFFGDAILVRQAQRMVRTPFADSLVVPVRTALNAVDVVMSRRPTFDHRSDEATFTIIATDYVTMVLLRPMFAVLEASAPNVRIIVKSIEESYATTLRRGDADLMILPAELVDVQEGFESQALFSDRFVLVVDRAHPSVGESVTLEEMLNLKYASYHSGAINPIADADLERRGIRLRVEVTTGDFVVAPFLVSGTALASITLERLAKELAEPAGLRIVDCPVELRIIHERMYWNSRHTADVAHSWLRATVAQFAARLSDSGEG